MEQVHERHNTINLPYSAQEHMRRLIQLRLNEWLVRYTINDIGLKTSSTGYRSTESTRNQRIFKLINPLGQVCWCRFVIEGDDVLICFTPGTEGYHNLYYNRIK
jgi:hypothetical protein